ncbi:MAG TPA: zinc-dependent alcohol dehydrogenase family protein [Anaeromyxobacteraceae bacterium]|nr:zinc-dependent alcohol dehydrogenase family protein [Anaeromyxobacteraceae bacterium]
MRAVLYENFGQRPSVQVVPDPTPDQGGVVIKVGASGVCRSDWHGWMGRDPDIHLPHVPGHELAGEVVAIASDVRRWRPGDRVTLPFACGCGRCAQCAQGNQHICDHQFQPGFTHWGSFAEYVAIGYADENLVRLPDELDFVTAASLGCRFATSFRAIAHLAGLRAGEWIAVHGCGGVGLSAILIARALGASVVAIDIGDEPLRVARSLGADVSLNARGISNISQIVKDHTGGGAHVSIDALGHPATCSASIQSLRKRGRHVQIGLLLGAERHPSIPMDEVIAKELRILGSHGMPAHDYPDMLRMISNGELEPQRLIGGRITLEESVNVLTDMGVFRGSGIRVVDRF